MSEQQNTQQSEQPKLQPGVAEKLVGVVFLDPTTLSKISPLSVDALNMLTIEQLTGLFTVAVIDAVNIKAKFQNVPQQHAVTVNALVTAEATTEENKFGKWSAMRTQYSVGALSGLGALNIDNDQIGYLGETIYTLFSDAGDVVGAAYMFACRVQMGEIKLKDITAERRIRDYRVDREQKMVRVVTRYQHEAAWVGLRKVLNPSVNTIVAGTATLFDNYELGSIQPNTTISLEKGATSSPQRLRTQVLTTAEHVGKNLTGEVVLTAEDVMAEITAALDILSLEIVHRRLGIDYNEKQKLAHVSEVLDALGYTDVSHWVRLAEAWRLYCQRWSEVVSAGMNGVDNAALFYLGEASSNIGAHALFVNFDEGGEASNADSFREQVRPTIPVGTSTANQLQPQAGRKLSWSFFASINLTFGFSK